MLYLWLTCIRGKGANDYIQVEIMEGVNHCLLMMIVRCNK